MRHDQHRPVLDGKSEEGPLDLVAIADPGDVVLGIRSIDRVDRHLQGTPPGAADVVGAGVDEESMQPSVESIAVAQTAQVAPGPDERVLDGILRGIPIAQDPPRDRVQAVVCGGHEVIKGLVIAPLCALDEFGRQRRPLGS
jgi:hypothetical protein